MYRELINSLTFMYGYVCKGRRVLDKSQMEAIAKSAHVMTDCAPAVLLNPTAVMAAGAAAENDEDRKDLQEAGKIAEHIDEMYVFLTNMEIF